MVEETLAVGKLGFFSCELSAWMLSHTEKAFQSAAELNRKMHRFFKATRSVFYVCSADSERIL